LTGHSANRVTELLSAVERGDADAREQLWSTLYDELHAIARHQMAAEAPGRTLQPTALVHEAYLRLFGRDRAHFANRKHFFTSAAQVMRRIRLDDARRRKRLKRGGPGINPDAPPPLAVRDGSDQVVHSRAVGKPAARREYDTPVIFDQDPAEIMALDEALARLEQEDPQRAEVVNLRYFAGLTIDQSAEALGRSPRSIDNDWRLARAWLFRAMGGEE